MIQQDHTAPIYAVRVSKSERYQVVFQSFMDEEMTQPLGQAGKVFFCDLKDQSGMIKLKLTEGSGISHPDTNAVLVSFSTLQMAALSPGQFNAMVYSKTGGEVENLVLIKLTVV